MHLLALLPPTALMGMSLPFLVRACVRACEGAGRTIGLLYAVNIFGAALGALAAPFWLHLALRVAGGGLRRGRRERGGRTAAPSHGAPGAGSPRRRRGLAPPPVPTSRPRRGRAGAAPRVGSALRALGLRRPLARDPLVPGHGRGGEVHGLHVRNRARHLPAGTGLGSPRRRSTRSRVRRPLARVSLVPVRSSAAGGAAVLLLVALPHRRPALRRFVRAIGREYDGFLLGRAADARASASLYLAVPAALFLVAHGADGAVVPDPATRGAGRPGHQRAQGGHPAGREHRGLRGWGACSSASSALGTSARAETLRLLVAVGLLFAPRGLALLRSRVPLAVAMAHGRRSPGVPGQERLWRRLHGLSPDVKRRSSTRTPRASWR